MVQAWNAALDEHFINEAEFKRNAWTILGSCTVYCTVKMQLM